MHYYKLNLDNLLVVHDDLDLFFLSMKFQKNRGSAGHNGLKNINQELKSQDYVRLRLGVAGHLPSAAGGDTSSPATNTIESKKETPGKVDAMSLMGITSPDVKLKPSVLKPFSKANQKKLSGFLGECVEAVEYYVTAGLEKAAGRYNKPRN